MSDFNSFAPGYAARRPQLVWHRIIADTETPVSAMLKLGRGGSGAFLLESVEGGAVRGRYSLLGLEPDLVWRATGKAAEINTQWATDTTAFVPCAGDTLTELRALVASCRMDVPPELPRALACLVGYMGYETARLAEKLPEPKADPLGVPDFLFVRPTLLLVFDRLRDELFLVAPVFPDARSAEVAHAAALERIESAAARLAQPVPPARQTPADLPDGAAHHVLRRRHFPGRAGATLHCRFPVAAVRSLSCSAPHQSLAVPVFPRLAGVCADRLVTRNPRAGP